MYSYTDLAGISFAFLILGLLLYVIFSQTTVRKLRKNTETKDTLGLTFMSGGDIYNVAAALSYPSFFLKRLEKGQLRYGIQVVADKKILLEHTNLFDRFFARIVFWLLHISLLSMFIFAVLDDITS